MNNFGVNNVRTVADQTVKFYLKLLISTIVEENH